MWCKKNVAVLGICLYRFAFSEVYDFIGRIGMRLKEFLFGHKMEYNSASAMKQRHS